MANARVKINHRGIQEYLDGKHGVEAVLEDEAQKRLERAKATAPVDSGAYRDSIHVETVHTDRMVKRVVADVDYAMVVEADTGNLARSL
jgi:hypothetical protein